jgi:predicted DNA-binding transcriptional regulator YafY
MKTDRILSIIMLLLSGKTMKAEEFAKILNVSTRTIIRDVDDIINAGMPLVTITGSKGGIRIDEDFKSGNPSLFTADVGTAILTVINMYPELLEIDDAYILAKYKNSKRKPSSDKITLTEVKIRFHESYMGYINKFYDYVDITYNKDNYCEAHIKIPDAEEEYDRLLLLCDKLKCLKPLHISEYIINKAEEILKLNKI